MELTIQKQSLLEVLQTAQGIVEKRSSMPILSNILIETREEDVQIVATDLQVGIRLKCPAKIIQPGGISILARKFYEIVRELPDEEIYLKLKENNRLLISSKGAQFNIVGLPALDYPPLPDAEIIKSIALDGAVIRDMIQKTIISVSLDEGRYNLSGIYFEYLTKDENTLLRMVSTDGHRLTIMEKPTETLEEGLFSKGVLLPRKAVTELLKILEKPGPIQIGFKDNYGVFQKEDTLMIMRLLESNFPDYNLVLPKKKDKSINILKNDLIDTMKRMAILSTDKYKGVKFSLTEGNLEIQSVNPDLGDAKESLSLDYKEGNLEIGFNARFFIDALQVMESETIVLDLSDSVSPAILSGLKDPGFMALIMPMKLTEESGEIQ
ncbi:MAG: DNA polymerase III subunit beta [Deltaproteobacteria bacterium]|nr:DNA polymerase III subunit beta [Deltaproteobacteria bacterium]